MPPSEGAMHRGKKKFVIACFFRVTTSLWPQTTTVTSIARIVPGD
jgi:hypothetical protein